MDWYKQPWRHYATFTGRAQRAEYWWFVGINTAIIIVCRIILVSVLLSNQEQIGQSNAVLTTFVVGFSIAMGIFGLAAIIPTIAVAARRLHDIGKSGWWQLLVLIPIIGALIIFVMTLLDGESGDNEYGADPKELTPVSRSRTHPA